MTKIAFIGTYIPQRCGIATYTHHLRQSIRGREDGGASIRLLLCGRARLRDWRRLPVFGSSTSMTGTLISGRLTG